MKKYIANIITGSRAIFISRNIYAQTREECEAKLAVLIVEMKAEIKAEKERRKQAASV